MALRLLPMRKPCLVILIAACLAASGCATFDHPEKLELGEPELVHAWTRMDYEPCDSLKSPTPGALPVYNGAVLAGVELDRRGNIYVTTPRWLNGRIPATLNQIVMVNGKTLLRAFPDCGSHAPGRAGAFRNILGVEVDSRNRMWILDMGWVAGEERAPDDGQKIVVIDLDSGRELKRYVFPDAVADRRLSFLNDLVIDEGREIAYISDSGNRSGSPTASGIVIYDFKDNRAWRVLDRHPSVQDDPARSLTVDGERVLPGGRLAVGINGIALSPDGSRLYWGITTGDAIYSMPTAAILAPDATVEEISSAISRPHRIGGGSDGLSMDNRGRVYITNLSGNKVEAWDPAAGSTVTIAEGKNFIWPDSLSWDDRGGLYISTNHLNHAFSGKMDYSRSEPNFRIFRIQTNATKGYVR